MLDITETRHAVLAIVGGALWSIVLTLDDIAPDYVGLAVVVPVLIGFGVLEIYGRYREYYGSAGRAGVALTGIGLAFLLVAILLYAVIPPGLLVVVLVAVPGITGIVTLTLGSALLAMALYHLAILRTLGAVLLGLGVPLTPLSGALLAALVGPGTLFGPIVPAGVAPGFSGALYGIGWILVGYRLWETAGEDHCTRSVERSLTIEISPQVVSAAVVGGVFVLLSIGRFIPLGPLSGTPWVNQSLVLDAGHLLLGAAGLAVAALWDGRSTRTYNQVVGLLSLSIVALTFFGTFQGIRWLGWLAVDLFKLNMPDILLHLPAGVVLVVVGFGIDAGNDSESTS